ncbi:MAG: hypothetical protein U0795_18740 [Pirellulales bacterium]
MMLGKYLAISVMACALMVVSNVSSAAGRADSVRGPRYLGGRTWRGMGSNLDTGSRNRWINRGRRNVFVSPFPEGPTKASERSVPTWYEIEMQAATGPAPTTPSPPPR